MTWLTRRGHAAQRLALPACAGLLAAATQLLAPTLALAAKPTLVVLGLRSLEGDDEFAMQLSHALRKQARSLRRWRVSGRTVSLAQMALAHGCDNPDPSCLTDIALALRAHKLLYGTVQRTGKDSEVFVVLELFDQDRGAIEGDTELRADASVHDPSRLASLAREALRRLGKLGPPPTPRARKPAPKPKAPAPSTGSVLVAANVEEANVLLDGKPAGQIEGGSLQLDGIVPGRHRISLEADGYQPASGSLSVMAGRQTPVELRLVADDPGGVDSDGTPRETVLGISLLAGGAALLAGTVYSWVSIEKINRDDTFLEYRRAVGSSPNPESDVCQAAKRGEAYGLTQANVSRVKDLCGRADLLEAMQYVLLASAAVAAGVGTYFLVAGDRDREALASKPPRLAKPRVSLHPRLARHAASLTASVSF